MGEVPQVGEVTRLGEVPQVGEVIVCPYNLSFLFDHIPRAIINGSCNYMIGGVTRHK